MSTYYDIAKKDFYKFLKERKIKNSFFEDFVENNKFGFLSLLRLSKVDRYPFNWLSDDQKKFVIQGGEEWLFLFLGKPLPIFDRSFEYKEIHVGKVTKVINEILEEKGIKFSTNYSTYFERFIRLKISPESYKKFYYIAVPVGFLYGLADNRFNFTEKENFYGKFFTNYFLNGFLDSFLHHKLNEIIKSIDVEQIRAVIPVLEEVEGKGVDGVNIIIDKLIRLEEKVEKIKEIESFEKEFSVYAKSKKTIQLEEKVEKIEKEIKEVLPHKTPSKFKEITGIPYRTFIENLKKDSLGIRSYERMMSIVKRLKEDKRFEKAGELAEKLLREKEILKKKGTSSKTFSIPNKVKEPVEKISLAEEYEKILKEKGFLPKNREIPNHKKLEIGEILYRMKEILEEDKISVDKVTFRLR